MILILNLAIGGLVSSEGLFAGRFAGIFENPNNIGLIVCLAIPLALSRWIHTRKRLGMIVTGVFVVSLMVAGTRSAILGVSIAFIVIVVSSQINSPHRAILIGVFVIAVGGYFTQTAFFEEYVLRETSLRTGSNRLMIWDIANVYIDNKPVLGHGFGTDALIHDYYRFHLQRYGLRGYGAASSYYGLAIQIGWPFTFVIFGLLFGFIIVCIVRYWRDHTIVMLGATLLSGIIVSFFESTFYSAGNAFSFLFWICVMLALRRIKYKRRNMLDSSGALLIPPSLRR